MDSLQTPRRALRDTKNVNATPFVTPKNRVMQLQNTPIFETGFQVFGGMMKGAGRSERHETAEEQFSRCEPDAGLERFAHEDTFEHLLRIEEDSDCVGKMAFRLLSDGQLSEKVFHELLTDDEMESLKSGKPLYQGDLDAVLKELGIE